MVVFTSLVEQGFLKTKLSLIGVRDSLLRSKSISQNGTWDTLDYEVPDTELRKFKDLLSGDPFLNQYCDYIKTYAYCFHKGHSLPTHSDESPFSPFIAQLFYVMPEDGLEGCDIVFNREGVSQTMSIKDNDLFVFYTYPNKFSCSMTEILSNHKVYVVNFLACPDNDFCNWIYRDVL